MKRVTHFGNYAVPAAGTNYNAKIGCHITPIGTSLSPRSLPYRLFAPKGLLMRDGEQVELIDGVHLRALDDSAVK